MFVKRFLPHARISPIHIGVVLLSLSTIVATWQYSKKQNALKVEERFQTSRDRVVSLIQDRMQKYEDALWAGVSAMESHGTEMSLDEWRLFSETMRIDVKYPGINGIGVIHFLNTQSLRPYLEDRRDERPAFRIHPAHNQDVMMPISFIEPEGPNAAAVGLDIAHETNRRMAALASRDTGHAQITGPIVLVQDAGATPGFLFYAPIYRAGATETVTQRQELFVGAVYAPFVVRSLMDGLLANELRAIDLSITDAEEVIFDEHLGREALHDPNPMFSDKLILDFYGREWVLDIRSNLAFRQNNTTIQPMIIFTSGIVIKALILGMIIMMSRVNRKAVTYAHKITDELRQEKEKLARSNVELEQFAYVISHDLKTPIRGIGGLAEILKEDLEEYFKSNNADPEVATAIDLIQDRVQRMNDLTSGILEFSCVRQSNEQGKPLNLRHIVTSMITDFGLEPDQLLLDTKVEHVLVDTINLRRVLENLIGNAIKYHHGKARLRIYVEVQERGETIEFTVSDNGPGIDVRHQKKVFEMFQTLRIDDAPESTGIGLAIVKKSVELHGGEIRLTSLPGGGASFSFQWPNQTVSPKNSLETKTAA